MKNRSAPTERRLAVFATDPALVAGLPRDRQIRYFERATLAAAREWTSIFLFTRLHDLGTTAAFAREANHRHHLKALFVTTNGDVALLPQYVTQAGLRTLRNLFAHADSAIPSRVLNAYRIGAEHDLIATASPADELAVVTCTSDLLRIPWDSVRALRALPADSRSRFHIASDGAFLHWPQANIHLGVQDFHMAIDPQLSRLAEVTRLLQRERLGYAVARIRRDRGLRQTDISELSSRQVRRIEAGAPTTVAALRKLARAHGMSFRDYTDTLAVAVTAVDADGNSATEASRPG